MYEYKFVKIELKFLSRRPKEDYHKIVEQYAKAGWRLVQIFAPPIRSDGSAPFFELIFEKEKTNTSQI